MVSLLVWIFFQIQRQMEVKRYHIKVRQVDTRTRKNRGSAVWVSHDLTEKEKIVLKKSVKAL